MPNSQEEANVEATKAHARLMNAQAEALEEKTKALQGD